MCRLIAAQALWYDMGLAGPGAVVALFAASSAASLPGIPQWAGTHCIVISAEQVAIAMMMSSTPGFLELRASHRDFESIMISTDWFCEQFLPIHSQAVSIAWCSSSYEHVSSAPRTVIVSLMVGSRGLLSAMTMPAPPWDVPALADPSVYITRSGARDVIRLADAAWLVASLWFLSITPSSVEYTAKLFGEIHGSRTYSLIFCLFARPSGRLYLPLIEGAREDQLLRLFFGGCALVRASFLGWSTGMRAAFS